MWPPPIHAQFIYFSGGFHFGKIWSSDGTGSSSILARFGQVTGRMVMGESSVDTRHSSMEGRQKVHSAWTCFGSRVDERPETINDVLVQVSKWHCLWFETLSSELERQKLLIEDCELGHGCHAAFILKRTCK
eukprot:1233424-Amphidinium_carterae.1